MIKAIRGTKDILPGDSYRWQILESVSRGVFSRFGYKEIRTPIIEETALFVKSVGEDTDIVNKEMFSFVDRGERNISLRPEGTAPIVRAYLENNLCKTAPFQKLYYMGPMFRAERPQAGRLRQFHQIGLEAIGSFSPALDAEVIRILTALLSENGIKDYELRINNLGCHDDKKKLSAALRAEFSSSDVSQQLCEDCRRRVNTNPLRLLDCKNDKCRQTVRKNFKKIDFLCQSCRDHFAEVLKFLDILKIRYAVDPYIVRGLDYYTKTVFEVVQMSLGSQNAIGAGGRYDSLISDMGGPRTGACGFALGADRMIMALGSDAASAAAAEGGVDIFLAVLGAKAYDKAFAVLDELRSAGLSCEIDYEAKSLKAQMRAADGMNARFVLILGEDEMAKGEALLRNMKTREQTSLKLEAIAGSIKEKIHSEVKLKCYVLILAVN